MMSDCGASSETWNRRLAMLGAESFVSGLYSRIVKVLGRWANSGIHAYNDLCARFDSARY
jgi:hypothetical protein